MTRYGSQPTVPVRVPVEMQERYEFEYWTVTGGKATVEGRATYSDFQRFSIESKLVPGGR
jgi:hypothetical protein